MEIQSGPDFKDASLGKPLLMVFLVIVWSALVPDVVRVARLDKPFYKKNQDRTTADVLLVQ